LGREMARLFGACPDCNHSVLLIGFIKRRESMTFYLQCPACLK
jgi:hypothetical protein